MAFGVRPIPFSGCETLDKILVGVRIEFRFHAGFRADAGERLFELFTKIRILFVIGNRCAAVF